MNYYVTKTITVKAIQFNGLNLEECKDFCVGNEVIKRNPYSWSSRHTELLIRTDRYDINICEGDWILKLETGELVGCDNDIFMYYYKPIASHTEKPVKGRYPWFEEQVIKQVDWEAMATLLKLINKLKEE